MLPGVSTDEFSRLSRLLSLSLKATECSLQFAAETRARVRNPCTRVGR